MTPWLKDIAFNEDAIMIVIDELSPSAAHGSDKFPVNLLMKCKEVLSQPLHHIWQKSLSLGQYPTYIKLPDVIPIHKGGSQGSARNYRPVALTSHLSKVFEKVFRKFIVAFSEEHNLFNPTRHGFRLGRSCLSQLIDHYDHITQLLEKGENIDVIYVDFTKAFVKVDFQDILRKIKQLEIFGKLGRWIYSFLSDRKQSVTVNGIKSCSVDVKSGVSQGSVLGPLLFLVLMGDIDHRVASAFLSSFADDTRVLKGITTHADVQVLQLDLDAIYQWAKDNMTFNSNKFECLRYGYNHELKENTSYLSSDRLPITVVDNVKDLGITMSSDGTFKNHINTAIHTANHICGWTLKTFYSRQRQPMLTLRKTLIHPKLHYCSKLYNSNKTWDIEELE